MRKPAQEDGDDAGLAVRVLPRPVDVAEAKRGVPAAVEPVVRREVLLARELRDAVRRERPSLRVLRGQGRRTRRRWRRRSRRRRCAFRARARPRAAGSSRARSPRRRTRARSTDTRTSACAARWKTTVGLTRPKSSFWGSRTSPWTSAARLGHVLALAVREVVDDDHLVAARDQGIDDVRADEARAPCDDRPHGLVS